MDTCIKDVDETSWRKFKVEAVRHGLKMGEFLGRLLEEHEYLEKSAQKSWEMILKGRSLLTEKDAGELRKKIKEFRKGFEFRDIV